jgi:hypothetical protein
MEQQVEEAIKSVLEHDVENAATLVDQGVLGFQRTALEEGIRISLEDYRKNGVPAGATRITVATKEVLECTRDVNKDIEECKEADGIIGSIACELAGIGDKLGCVVEEVVDRYL